MSNRFTIITTRQAQEDLKEIHDTRTYQAIVSKVRALDSEPHKQGKQLSGELSAYRVVRAAGQRYRVVYQVAMLEEVVTIVLVRISKEGDKRDTYRVASKRLGGR